VSENILKIIMGTGIFNQAFVSEFMEKVSYNELISSYENVITDMDRIADTLFKR
jgi:hypothetical protein